MLDKLLRDMTFSVVDTETTGMHPNNSQLLEIAVVKVKPDLTIDFKDTFSELIKPECPISYGAYAVHGISEEMVSDKPNISKIIPKFTDFVKDTVLVAHNARFDMSFIDNAISCNSLFCTHLAVLDTIKLSKQAFPHIKRYNLDNMINLLDLKLNIDESHRHRALYDALHTSLLLVKCIEELEKKGISYFSDL